MTFSEQLEIDRQLALEKGYTFSVALQDGQGERWEEQQSGIKDLQDAFRLANSLKAWKIGILLHREGLGFHYWDTHDPDCLNSTLLTMEMT